VSYFKGHTISVTY